MSQALLQVGTGDRTGIFVAVAILAVFALIGVYFLVRSKMEEASGAYDVEALYVLGRGKHPQLVEVGQAEVVPMATHRPGRRGLAELVGKLEHRNDVSIEAIVLENGDEVPFPHARESMGQIEAAILRDSRGEIRIDTDGRVTARPPLDAAVKRDLEELLVGIIQPPDEVHGEG